MRILSRKDIEMIAERVVTQYKALPEITNSQIYHVDPVLLAERVYGFYLEGGQLNCNRCFMDRYDVSDKTVQRWKKTFEQFVRNFYEKNVGF